MVGGTDLHREECYTRLDQLLYPIQQQLYQRSMRLCYRSIAAEKRLQWYVRSVVRQ
jgi:hypothetical protein